MSKGAVLPGSRVRAAHVDVKEKTVAQTTGLPLWGWAVGTVLLTTVTVLAYRTEQTEQHLKAVQGELERIKVEAVQAKSGAAEIQQLAANLRSKLEEAEREIQELNETAGKAKAEATEREKQIAMLRQGKASCDEFFEEWDEVKASPLSILVIFAITREAAAAKDCIDKGDVATACRHWRDLLVRIERIGSPVRESRVEVEELMRRNHCRK